MTLALTFVMTLVAIIVVAVAGTTLRSVMRWAPAVSLPIPALAPLTPSIGMSICSLSLQIVTICALILLMIAVSLLLAVTGLLLPLLAMVLPVLLGTYRGPPPGQPPNLLPSFDICFAVPGASSAPAVNTISAASLPSSGVSLEMLCSLSIPIVTICALILLVIVVTLVALVAPWLRFCLSLPSVEESR